MLSVSDWRSRDDSSTGSTEPEALSEAEESSEKDEQGSEKEEKPPVKDNKEAQKHDGKQNSFSVSKPSASSEQAKSVVHSTPKFESGKLCVYQNTSFTENRGKGKGKSIHSQ